MKKLIFLKASSDKKKFKMIFFIYAFFFNFEITASFINKNDTITMFEKNISNNVQTSSTNIGKGDIEFGAADITVFTTSETNSESGVILIEAFKTTKNDNFLSSKDERKYSRLEWVSIGYPSLLTTKPHNQTFFFDKNGFFAFVDMLTDSQVESIRERIKSKYGITVDSNQIFTLIPDKFDCIMEISCGFSNIEIIKGKVLRFDEFPFKLYFAISPNSFLRTCAENQLNVPNSFMQINCKIESDAFITNQMSLSIRSSQLNKIGIVDKLFGPANSVYISREQVSNLANEIAQSLNVYEEYRMTSEMFSSDFIDDFIKKTSSNVFESVSIDTALKYISKYSMEDLEPDQIKSNLSKIFELTKVNDKIKIIMNKDFKEMMARKGDSNFNNNWKLNIGPISFSQTYEKGGKFEKENEFSSKSAFEQLKELNKELQNEIEYEIKGNILVPKSLNLTKLIRSSFSKTLVFTRIRKDISEYLFSRNFNLFLSKSFLPTTKTTTEKTTTTKTSTSTTTTKKIITSKTTKKTATTKTTTKKIITSKTTKKTPTTKTTTKKILYSTATTRTSTTTSNITPTTIGNLVISLSEKKIIIYDGNTGLVLNSLNSNFSSIRTVKLLLYDNQTLLCCDDTEQFLEIWDISKGLLIQRITKSCIYLVKLKNGNVLIKGYFGPTTILTKDNLTNSFEVLMHSKTDGVTFVDISKNNETIIGSWYSLSIYNPDATLKYTYSKFGYLSFQELSNGNFATGQWDNNVYIWKLNNGIQLLFTLIGHSGPVTTLQLINDVLFASASSYSDTPNTNGVWGDKKIFIWNYISGTLVKILEGHTNFVNNILKLNFMNILVSSDYNFQIKLWNLDNFNCLNTLSFAENTINQRKSFYFNQLENGYLVTASNYYSFIKIWDIKSGQLIFNLTKQTGVVAGLLITRNNYDFNRY